MRKIFSAFLLSIFSICVCLVQIGYASDGNIAVVRDAIFDKYDSVLTFGETLQENLGPVTWSSEKKGPRTFVHARVDLGKSFLQEVREEIPKLKEAAKEYRQMNDDQKGVLHIFSALNSGNPLNLLNPSISDAEVHLKVAKLMEDYIVKYRYVYFDFTLLKTEGFRLDRVYLIHPKTNENFSQECNVSAIYSKEGIHRGVGAMIGAVIKQYLD